MSLKAKLRKSLLIQRSLMDKQEVESLSQGIMEKLVKVKPFLESKVVMIYLSFKNEVATDKIINWCFKQGKEVVVPYCIVDTKEIIPCKLDPERKNLIKNKYGIWEPSKDSRIPVDIEEIDTIIIPGVGFDKNCNRLGFGGGYYDRFLVKRKKEASAIAICYENQIVEAVPTDSYDIPMDIVVTEESLFYRK